MFVCTVAQNMTKCLRTRGVRLREVSINRGSTVQSTCMSHRTSISENEMNIQIPLCNVQHLNGILNISLEIFPKKTH